MNNTTRHSRPRKNSGSKSFLKTFLYAGLAFGIWMGIAFGIWMGLVFGVGFGWQVAILMGLVAGLFFGLTIAGFTAVLSKRMSGRLPLHAGEEVLKEGPACHAFKGESVGGWLTLTNQRLHFTSHKINIQTHDLSLPLYEIAAAQTVATARIVPNGLQIKTASGDVERFVVNGRAEWVDALARAKQLRI